MVRRPLAFACVTALLLVACSADDGTPPASGTDGGGDATADVQLPGNDAAPADAAPDAPTLGCGEFSGFDRYTCSKDGTTRGKCPGDASLTSEVCARGCLRDVPPQDDVCLGTTSSFSCAGSIGTVKAADGDYYLTAFGC